MEHVAQLAKIAPSFGFSLCDFNADGYLDIALAKNFFRPQRETGRIDGGFGLLLTENGTGEFTPCWPIESGIVMLEDAKGLTVMGVDRNLTPDLVLSTNDGPVKVFTNSESPNRFFMVRLHGPQGNPDGIGSWVFIEKKKTRAGWFRRFMLAEVICLSRPHR